MRLAHAALLIMLLPATTLAHDWNGIAIDARNHVFVIDAEFGEIWRIDGEVVRIAGGRRTVLARGLEYPSGLAFDSQGRLYIKESGRMTHKNMTVRRVDADGSVRLFATVALRRAAAKPPKKKVPKAKVPPPAKR